MDSMQRNNEFDDIVDGYECKSMRRQINLPLHEEEKFICYSQLLLFNNWLFDQLVYEFKYIKTSLSVHSPIVKTSL